MNRIRAVIITAATAGALLLAADPARAHNTISFHGSDWAAVNVAHSTIVVHDGECDSWNAMAQFYSRDYAGGPLEQESVMDPDDCLGSDNSRNRYQITSYRVCEGSYSTGRPVSCSGWVSNP